MRPEVARLSRAALLYIRAASDQRHGLIDELSAARKRVTPMLETDRALVSAAQTVAVYPGSEDAIDLLGAAVRLVHNGE